jgi:hypothetical protein
MIAGYIKVGDVIVPVKILALAAVPMESMTGAKSNSPHNCKVHVVIQR